MAKIFFAVLLAWGAGNKGEALSALQLEQKLIQYKNIKGLKAQFTQTKTFHGMGLKIKSEGQLEVTRPDGVVWTVLKPSRVQVSMNSQEIRMESGGEQGSEKSIQTIKMSEIGNAKASLASLVAWLNLDAKKIYEEYVVLSLEASLYKFIPRKPAATPFKELLMTLSSSGHLSRLVIHELSGDEMDISFSPPKMIYGQGFYP